MRDLTDKKINSIACYFEMLSKLSLFAGRIPEDLVAGNWKAIAGEIQSVLECSREKLTKLQKYMDYIEGPIDEILIQAKK